MTIMIIMKNMMIIISPNKPLIALKWPPKYSLKRDDAVDVKARGEGRTPGAARPRRQVSSSAGELLEQYAAGAPHISFSNDW